MKPKKIEDMPSTIDPADEFGFKNELDIPVEVRKEMEELGYVPRWLNAKKFEANGFHTSGWKVYHSEVAKTYATIDLKRGASPDGVIRRRDSVLGYKPKSANEAQKRKLKMLADAQAGSSRYKQEKG